MELPLGFGMALAQNEEAMEFFSKLPKQKQEEVLNQIHDIQSRDEMHAFVQDLPNKI